MAFNFPASPTNGQTYTPAGGPVFTYDGTAWKALSQGMPVIVFVADTPPGAPAFGNLWWESDTGNLYIYYNDADSAQWVQINGLPAGTKTAQRRNRIVNPAMQISQENGSTAVATNLGYPVDQFQLQFTITTVNAIKSTHGVNAPMPYSLATSQATAKPSLAASDVWQLVQFIEGINIADFRFGTPRAMPVVARFKAFCTQAGTFTFALKNGATDRIFMAPFTLSAINTWQEFVIPIPGDTLGTWPIDTTKGAVVAWGLAAGSTLNAGVAGWSTANMVQIAGHTNLAAIANSGFNITDVGLYLDPENTGVPPPWEMPDEAEELRACQRYWHQSGYLNLNFVATVGGQYGIYSVPFPVQMRATPAVGVLATGTFANTSNVINDNQSVHGLGRLGVQATAVGQAAVSNRVLAYNARM